MPGDAPLTSPGPAGRVVVLNGTSSAGKTTLATMLQSRLASDGDCWIVLGIDDVFLKLPHDWIRLRDWLGAYAEEGIAFETIDGEVERRVGPIGTRTLAAYRGWVGAAARAGLNVIVDEVLLDESDWIGWQQELDGLDVTWVRVDIALDALEARERERGDRMIGLARSQYDIVHRFPKYDLRVDTGVVDPDSATDAVLELVRRSR
jgi:chloramphenicol 3-O phosphotransferase